MVLQLLFGEGPLELVGCRGGIRRLRIFSTSSRCLASLPSWFALLSSLFCSVLHCSASSSRCFDLLRVHFTLFSAVLACFAFFSRWFAIVALLYILSRSFPLFSALLGYFASLSPSFRCLPASLLFWLLSPIFSSSAPLLLLFVKTPPSCRLFVFGAV